MEDEDFDFTGAESPGKSFWQRLPPAVRAAVIWGLGLTVVNVINAVSGGTAIALTFPIMALIYIGCGALACWFADSEGAFHSPAHTGATAGLALWGLSLVANLVIVGVVMGLLTMGTTMILGVPYLCFCAPIELVGGGLGGALGSVLYHKFFGGRGSSSNDYESW
ncbi:MAG TPA: hypothetical protein PLE00_05070 [Anaerolineaceae bacterium]|nr:hypothetical protein [Anaerolineaceae bacterium]